MTWLFVDGYNIIGAWPEFAGDEDLDTARKTLGEMLKEFAASVAWRVILVYDGYRVRGGSERVEPGRYLDTVFTGEGVTADMYIERAVARLSRYEEVYVASSDRLVQETILTQGALRLSAAELGRLIREEKQAVRRRLPQGERSSPLDARLSPEQRARLRALYHDENDAKKS